MIYKNKLDFFFQKKVQLLIRCRFFLKKNNIKHSYSGTPLIRSPMGPKNLAVLTRVYFTRKCMAVFAREPKKVAVITR